jgi:1-acyl-sn-glycerol-3-phosphate acyltransferase
VSEERGAVPQSDWLGRLWYDFGYTVTMAAMTLGFSFRSTGRRNVPCKGPVLLLANHQSFLDPPLVGLGTVRRLSYLARKTLFNNPLFARFITSLNAIPVDQEGVGKEGLRAVIEHLKAGEAVLVFPEGERTATGQMEPFRPGVHLLIRKAPVPIVPVGLAGAFESFPRHRKFPRLSPLFWPPTGAGLAVAMGKPLDGRRFAQMPREQALVELFKAVQEAQLQAERIRRK